MDEVKINGIYRHIKGNYYIVENLATSCEDESILVIYRALYGENKLWVRSLKEFTSKVDKEKYPESKQTYKFELQEIASKY